MRYIDEIIIHCTATKAGKPVSVNTIRKWHLARGFSDIGYHYIVGIGGNIMVGRAINLAGAHTRGRNKNTIGICYVGGVDLDLNPLDTRTPAQKESIRNLVRSLKVVFPTIKKVNGHYKYSSKACPSFNVEAENYG